ncbi:hypothetical protein L1987_15403 [Smallanthus sonchifolius]|uniref:Uncharacterized protein n=1 Tax=Smallanthus sonchifolius TaxID=185202 RepID=A0ACB9J5D6_9ASTR|nr:hypothetical protein L1987_15403 [Smallanthus sonchifolius]
MFRHQTKVEKLEAQVEGLQGQIDVLKKHDEFKLKAYKDNAQDFNDLQSIVEKQQKELLFNYRQLAEMQILIEALMDIDDMDLNDVDEDNDDDDDSLEVEIEKHNNDVTYEGEGEGVEITSTLMKDIISPEIIFEFQDQIFDEQTPEVEKHDSTHEEHVQEEAPQLYRHTGPLMP